MPAHRGELKTNPNILNLFWNRIPNISHVPMSLKETVAVEQSLTRRLHLVVHHILALRSREALLDNFLDNLLRSDLLPLSDCSLARRAIRASRRSPPQPPTTGRL